MMSYDREVALLENRLRGVRPLRKLEILPKVHEKLAPLE